MNLLPKYVLIPLILSFSAISHVAHTQQIDTTLVYPEISFDSTVFFSVGYQHDFLVHCPQKMDSKFVARHSYLKNRQPNSRNYRAYFRLACSLWELAQLDKAKKLFRNIVISEEEHYTNTYYHNSDIPGDTNHSYYGYGSYTSNYKHSAALYLAKIYIEEQQFDTAFFYMEQATKIYPVSYSCGTGFRLQENEFNSLYALIYDGQNRYDKIINLLMSDCFSNYNDILVKAIQKTYSKSEIAEQLQNAELTIQCEFDTFPSYSYLTTYNGSTKEGIHDTIAYYSAKAYTTFFGSTMSIPILRFANGQHIKREDFIQEFRRSEFYRDLLAN